MYLGPLVFRCLTAGNYTVLSLSLDFIGGPRTLETAPWRQLLPSLLGLNCLRKGVRLPATS